MKNNLLIDHTKLVIGQKLWDINNGEMIFRRNNNDSHYPLVFNGHRGEVSYSLNGKRSLSHQYPSLYLSNPFEQVNEFPKLMEVSTTGKEWIKRLIYCYNAQTSKYIAQHESKPLEWCGWQYAREIQEPQIIELSIEEIAKKLSLDPKLLRIKK